MKSWPKSFGIFLCDFVALVAFAIIYLIAKDLKTMGFLDLAELSRYACAVAIGCMATDLPYMLAEMRSRITGKPVVKWMAVLGRLGRFVWVAGWVCYFGGITIAKMVQGSTESTEFLVLVVLATMVSSALYLSELIDEYWHD